MTRRIKPACILPLPVLALAAVVSMTAAGQGGQQQRLTEAELFFELNDTDGDLGIHASIDGGPWTDLEIEGPGERTLLQIVSRGELRTQGLTQLMFESAEPSFDDLAPEEFFRRFPEGRYEIEGRLHDGRAVAGVASLSHILAAPPENITVSGLPAAEDCDAPFLPVVFAPVTIDWDPVTESHPDLGRSGPVKVSRYQLFVEREGFTLGLDLPPGVTEFALPTGVTNPGGEFKFEIIVRTGSGNNTAVESCFVVS